MNTGAYMEVIVLFQTNTNFHTMTTTTRSSTPVRDNPLQTETWIHGSSINDLPLWCGTTRSCVTISPGTGQINVIAQKQGQTHNNQQSHLLRRPPSQQKCPRLRWRHAEKGWHRRPGKLEGSGVNRDTPGKLKFWLVKEYMTDDHQQHCLHLLL